MSSDPLGPQIDTLETRRQELLARLRLPRHGLPGSLAESGRRCGSAGCHCQTGEPHRSWTLTFMRDGQKRVEHIPTDLLDTVRTRVTEGRAYQDAVAELLAVNAQLLLLRRRAHKQAAAAAGRRR